MVAKVASFLYKLLRLARKRLALRLVLECLHVDPHVVSRALGRGGREQRRDASIGYSVRIPLFGYECRKLRDFDSSARGLERHLGCLEQRVRNGFEATSGRVSRLLGKLVGFRDQRVRFGITLDQRRELIKRREATRPT